MSTAPSVTRVETSGPGTTFSAEARVDGAALVLKVAGDVDFDSASPQSTAPLDAAWAASGARDVVVDLAGVTFLDSGGLSWLVRLRSCARQRGGSVRLVGVPPRIERVLRISGVLPLFAA